MPVKHDQDSTPGVKLLRLFRKLLEDGSLVLDFDAQSDVEAVSWALGFGERCVILEPQWLREEIERQARALLAAYGEDQGA